MRGVQRSSSKMRVSSGNRVKTAYKTMRTILLAIVAVIVIGIGAVFFLRSGAPRTPAPRESVSPMPPSPLPSPTPVVSARANRSHRIRLQTSAGDITFETYDADAPKAVENFITLAERGFYNNSIFHRVIKSFMIQGGDPKGNGTGGPGYTFGDELNPATGSYQGGYRKGVVAMANAGPNTNGSQFFIMHQDYQLPHLYTIFGTVVAGQGVVDAIAEMPTGPNDRPLQPVTIKSVVVENVQQ